jgi:ribosomal protein L37AE/L43A
MDDRMLDGNAFAGLLREVFADEMTTAIGTCRHCGASGAMGSVHAYQGAGTVLRCPDCGHALVKIVRAETRLWISFPGVQTLEVAVGTT